MAFLLQTLWRGLTRRAPELVCDARTWNAGVDELHCRTGGRREAGAFLLGDTASGYRRIKQFLFYDDVDPNCFANGIVEFDGRHFGEVWRICGDLDLSVVADVHVHPGHYAQSLSDRQNPMIAEVGHLALIIPHFAGRDRMPGGIGIYEYEGARQWDDRSARGNRTFQVGWWPK